MFVHKFSSLYHLVYISQQIWLMYLISFLIYYQMYSNDIHTQEYKNELVQIIYKIQHGHILIC